MTSASVSVDNPPLVQPVTLLHGVGPERSRLLEKLNVRTVEDLLLYAPRRYEDRQNLRQIGQLQLGEAAITHGRIVTMGTSYMRQRTRSVFEIVLEDGTGRLHCRWWNLPFMEKKFQVEDEVLVFGKLLRLKPRTMDHPENEVLEGGEENFIHLNRLTPIYSLTEGLQQRWLRSLIFRTLLLHEQHISEPYPSELLAHAAPTRPREDRQLLCLSFPSRRRAVRMIHFPEAEEQIELARRRLALDEFVEFQRKIRQRRNHFETKADALPCGGDRNRFIKHYLTHLRFKLTTSQIEVLREIRKDMGGAHPMRRLLQGDVGSGKTVVAACSALMCLECGYEAALMAPTEVLAEQHFRNFSEWFRGLGIQVELRTGAYKFGAPVSQGTPNQHSLKLTIGTHALLQPGFVPERLGLVIIDEQHKFGVSQREQLVKKGRYPHLLVMTATPIPRSLGLTLYGDLDISTISHMPPGRGRVQTFTRSQDALPKVWDFVRSQLELGRQAYIVYPRVDAVGAGDDVKAVTKEFDILRQTLSPFAIGLIHGRVPPTQKDSIMAAFRDKKLQVLVATSLIEVGLDVPNASLMVIENAEQFGLAQLHQLRGRIGRGAHDSYCILVSKARTPESKQRLGVLEHSQDGFEIAEADLKLRGPGQLLGSEQSGVPRFRFGDLAKDMELICQAREIAGRLENGNSASLGGSRPVRRNIEVIRPN